MSYTLITSSGKDNFSYFPYTYGTLDFKVQAKSDVFVALTTKSQFDSPIFQIAIGFKENTSLAFIKGKDNLGQNPCKNLLNEKEYREFWMKWKETKNTLTIGKAGKETPIESDESKIVGSVEDAALSSIEYIGFASEGEATWIIPQKKCKCVVPTPGTEDIDKNTQWTPEKNGHTPEKGFVGGSDNSRHVYVCRANFKIPGVLHEDAKKGVVAWHDRKYEISSYEVLCSNEKGNWVKVTGGTIPQNAFVFGTSENAELLYVGRKVSDGVHAIGAASSHQGLCIYEGDKATYYRDYEVFVL